MMDTLPERVWTNFWHPETPHVVVLVVALALLSLRLIPRQRSRVVSTVTVFAVCLAGQLLGALLEALDHSRLAVLIRETFIIGSGMAVCRLLGLFFFRAVLPRVGVETPRIAEDLIVVVIYAVFIIARLHIVGLDPSSLLTTSAVITAVVALAMQDTLGNALSGVALQLDDSLHTGDWIRIDDLTGQVVQVRWRQTTIRTRNGEIVIVPNSQLMKGRFTVFGRVGVADWPWRRWVWFNVTYDSPPGQIIQVVESTIASAEIDNVANEPPPSCVLMDFGPGYARYALRYWMIDPQPDDPTDSAVRVHVFTALQRAGMQLAVPEQSMHVTKENEAYRRALHRRETERRVTGLHRVELFAGLQEEELRTISEQLVYAPFAAGDVIYRQGDSAHWLYLLADGEAEVFIDLPDHTRQHYRDVPTGSTFGERGVLTGEARRDTVIARTDVVCYRLGRATVEQLIRSRPEIANAIAEILCRRETEIEAFAHQFDDQAARPAAPHPAGMVDKIRAFLGL
ncbi:mechanosensitive ion channel family protein [Accumulibacter sp.]|uniref:mechanosensitive ion channel family protein n=1 Tax=Accumulibacter sp. TaxID=2053492 RepID=UPI0025FD27DB|nr:mechanosensitive ion channel family protein [Accumulibacter sp.]MCM8595551.1 mechanosensitive ion channel family protein [Accumulibacter sp.]MDS4049699.1 mechanosensitive ion channel family protein [Accumulibacter sp.]